MKPTVEMSDDFYKFYADYEEFEAFDNEADSNWLSQPESIEGDNRYWEEAYWDHPNGDDIFYDDMDSEKWND